MHTALRLSPGPETTYPLVINLATVSMFRKPFHSISCLDRNCAVTPSAGDWETIILKHNSVIKIITFHYTVIINTFLGIEKF